MSEDKGIKYVQLRLTPEQRTKLAEQAGKADRTVPEEIIHRLGLDEPALPGALDLGADAADYRAISDAVALLFMEVTRTAGRAASLRGRLSCLVPAVVALLQELGAIEVGPDDAKFFAGLARRLVDDEPQKAWATKFGAARDEGALAKVTRQIRTRITVEDEADAEFERRQEAQEADAIAFLASKDPKRSE